MPRKGRIISKKKLDGPALQSFLQRLKEPKPSLSELFNSPKARDPFADVKARVAREMAKRRAETHLRPAHRGKRPDGS